MNEKELKLKAAKLKLDRVMKRIEKLHDQERKLVFQHAMENQSANVCAHVQALKEGRKVGLEKLKEYSSTSKSKSTSASTSASKSTSTTTKAKSKAATRKSTSPSPKSTTKKTAAPCDDVSTVNKLIKCLETCCKKFEGNNK